MATIYEIKQAAKHGPKMSKQMRAEYIADAAGAKPRQLSPAVIRQFRSELARLALSPKPAVQRFVRQMICRYPNLI